MRKIQNDLPALNQLGDVFAIKADNLSAISLTGEEKSQYLQGQVTCDVNTLTEKKLLNGAHCNAKGKVFSVFRLFEHDNYLLLLQPQNTISASLAELKKFAVFAKVEIKQRNNLSCLVIAGTRAKATITTLLIAEQEALIPNASTPVINTTLNHEPISIIYLAGSVERYIIISNINNITTVGTQLTCPIYPAQLWQLLEINAGFPALSEAHIEEYVPQMLNLDTIDAISFTKGCYLGQETVARMQYLGKNKRALYSLTGRKVTANIGDIIEKQLGENWRKAGEVIANYQAKNGDSYIQAVLTNDIDDTTQLRIKNDVNGLTIAPLPYQLTFQHQDIT